MTWDPVRLYMPRFTVATVRSKFKPLTSSHMSAVATRDDDVRSTTPYGKRNVHESLCRSHTAPPSADAAESSEVVICHV